MKSIISLMFGGLLLTSSLSAQNFANNMPRILDEVSVVTGTAEDVGTNANARELTVMENSMRDYNTTIWSRDIYRQLSDIPGNEVFFRPFKSSDEGVNLFSLMINLFSTNTLGGYEYTAQPGEGKEGMLTGREMLKKTGIPFTEYGDGTVELNMADIPSDKITHYLVKEKWYFDTKTTKGFMRVTHICPVLCDKGKHIPLFWVRFDDLSAYLARVSSSVSVSYVKPVLANASVYDVISDRMYRGCIYQVGYRNLSTYYPDMKDLINERIRIENELDYMQTRFYAAQNRR